MLDASRRHQRDLQLLVRPAHPQVRGCGQIRATVIAGPGRAVIDHLIGFRPAHRGAGGSRLLTALAARAALAAFPARRLPPRQVISAGWHRGVAAVAAQPAPQLRDLGPKLLHRPAKLRDHLIAGGARRAPGRGRREIGHRPS